MMAAWRSIEPEERVEIFDELRQCRDARARYADHLARLERERAPHSYRGKLKAQIAACDRHEARMLRLLGEEVAA